MKSLKFIGSFAIALLAGASAWGQSAIDAYNMTQAGAQLRGTARFVAMGGAFTSLGGDLSTLSQNPAGLGVYRRSEVGLSFSINMHKSQALAGSEKYNTSYTKGSFDNIGYAGSYRLKGMLRNFNFGVSYSRLASVDRRYSGYNMPTSGSLSNYIASFTQGTDSGDMLFDNSQNYNPYRNSSCDWLSILAYNSMIINNTAGSDTDYTGLYQPGKTVGDAMYTVHEKGYTDSYDIDFGGNVSDIVYWGLGIGVVDMSYTRLIDYSESMADALIYDTTSRRLTDGNAGFGMYNQKYVSGTGANIKLGVIVRLLDQWKVGAAVHTPTWMALSSSGNADVDFNYTPNGASKADSGNEYTDDFDYNWHLTTPWKFMLGTSYVIANRAIVSIDYERQDYSSMSIGYQSFNRFGSGNYVKDDLANTAIKDYFKSTDIVRAGIEFRVLPMLSVRAGYNWAGSNVRSAAYNNRMEISTAGTDPSYTFNNDAHNITVGLGYRYKSWYIDATFQHTIQNASFHAYTPYGESIGNDKLAPAGADLKFTQNNLVFSTGFRF